MNGLGFDTTGANSYVLQRANATTIGVATAVLEIVQELPGGVDGAFSGGSLLSVINETYTSYLGLVASKIYFVEDPNNQPIVFGNLVAPEARLWVSVQAAHILAASFATLAVLGLVLAVLHNKERRFLRLAHEPGTIASAAAVAGHTEVAVILEGKDDEKTMKRLLGQHRYRIDPHSGKIVFDGEFGFDNRAESPQPNITTYGNIPPSSGSPGKARFSLNPLKKGNKIHDPEEIERNEEFRLSRLARLSSFRGAGRSNPNESRESQSQSQSQ